MPTTLPLTKREEEALKTVRKKLRNKVCYQTTLFYCHNINLRSLLLIRAEDARRNI